MSVAIEGDVRTLDVRTRTGLVDEALRIVGYAGMLPIEWRRPFRSNPVRCHTKVKKPRDRLRAIRLPQRHSAVAQKGVRMMPAETYRKPETAEEVFALERCRRKLAACAAEGFIKHYDVHGIVGDGPEISYSVDGWSQPRRVTVGRDFLWIRV